MLYKKVMQDIKSRIDSDEFNIGDLLPTEKELIEHYSVSRITVRKAINELVKLSLVEKRQGSGSTVIAKTMTSSLSTLKSASEYMEASGADLKYKVVEFKLLDADQDLANKLRIAVGDKVYFIRRFMLMNECPSIYEDTYMAAELFPHLNILSLESSKYQYLENDLGFQIDGALQDFEAILPDKHMCEVLGVAVDKPLIMILSQGKLKDGRVFEYTKSVFVPGTFSYKHYLHRH
jgi:DNA-binding GntR family transcriptional regulator